MITKRDIEAKSGVVLKRSLKASIRRFEGRYEMSSEDMAHAVKSDAMKETREVAKWLQHHMVLKRLTDTAGNRSKAIRASTKIGSTTTRS